MLIPKETTKTIYEYLFKEGTAVARKDLHAGKHPDIEASNLHVIKTMASLKSRGFVKETFAWRHYYWVVTNEGIQHLRDYLHLPPETVPNTMMKKSAQNRPPRARAPTGGARGPVSDSSRYYRKAEDAAAPCDADKKAEVGISSSRTFQFRGGFGRGRPRDGGDSGSSERPWRRDRD